MAAARRVSSHTAVRDAGLQSEAVIKKLILDYLSAVSMTIAKKIIPTYGTGNVSAHYI